jgi:hypothetical protein
MKQFSNHFLATKSHKESFLPANICAAPTGARKIHAEASDAFCAFSWQIIPEASF